MKQTAVEWLEEYIRCSIQLTDSEKKWFEQAKEMEKEQIGDAYERGFNQGYRDPEFLNTNDSDDE